MQKSDNNIEGYIEEGYTFHNNGNTEDFLHYLEQGEDNPEINYQALQEAADVLFGDKKGMPMEEYLRITKEFYETLDLETRGSPSLVLDTDLLLESFIRARDDILEKTTKGQKTDRVLVIGCGTGRLSTLYIEMAKKLGITHITFNDLLEKHIEQTKKRVQTTYNTGTLYSNELTIDGIKVEFLPGDFTTIDLKGTPYDIAVAWWFVTSEIFDPNSPEDLRRKRIKFYAKIRDNLIQKGIFIEDIPHSGLCGFYFLSRMKTLQILKERGILLGEQLNLSLSNVPKKSQDAQPFHIRYLPYNGAHHKEMNTSGLYKVDSRSEIIPTQAIIDGSFDFLKLFDGKKIGQIRKDIRSMLDLLVKRPRKPVDKKRKKITLWTPNHE